MELAEAQYDRIAPLLPVQRGNVKMLNLQGLILEGLCAGSSASVASLPATTNSPLPSMRQPLRGQALAEGSEV